jgi:nicotine blue oxidoreductase
MMVGVLLAAGAGTRMGRTKALVRSGPQSFLAHGVRNLWTVCDDVVVVLGAHASEVRKAAELEFERLVKEGGLHADLHRAHAHGSEGLEVEFTVNRSWRSGMLSSARLGIASALKRRPEGVLVMPVDHPFVRPLAFEAIATLLRGALEACESDAERSRLAYAIVPRWKRMRGHPLGLAPGLARAVVRDTGASDLSDAVRRNARLVGYVDVSDSGVVRNVNTPARRRR